MRLLNYPLTNTVQVYAQGLGTAIISAIDANNAVVAETEIIVANDNLKSGGGEDKPAKGISQTTLYRTIAKAA